MNEKQTKIDEALLHISNQFQIPGKIVSISLYGSGHIHQTYLILSNFDEKPIKQILQKVNPAVFTDPIGVMKNMVYVTEHLHQLQQTLRLIQTQKGANYYDHKEKGFWRCFDFIEETITFESVQNEQQAYEAGKTVGIFQTLLLPLPVTPLKETIPNFHNTPFRLKVFEEILNLDFKSRAELCSKEIDFALLWGKHCTRLLDLFRSKQIPERITHNDTKINNILFNKYTLKALCLIDLDTVMPGLSLYDFGDLVRTSISTVAEDELDLSQMSLAMDIFQGIVQGYLEETKSFLTLIEKEHLVYACQLLTYETGLRFLTDYLNGDSYFKTNYAQHNLDRCRNQFHLLQLLLEKEVELQKIIQNIVVEVC